MIKRSCGIKSQAFAIKSEKKVQHQGFFRVAEQ